MNCFYKHTIFGQKYPKMAIVYYDEAVHLAQAKKIKKYVLEPIYYMCLTWCKILLIENGNGLADCKKAFCKDAAAAFAICKEFTEFFVSTSPTSTGSMTWIGFKKSCNG